jgi:hypothetical protein
MSEHETDIIPPDQDMDRLKQSSFFYTPTTDKGEPITDEGLWKTVTDVRTLLNNEPHDTVYYPGAYADFAFPLSMVDASTYVFVDPSYKGLYGHDLLLTKLKDIDITPTVVTAEGKTQIDFSFNGKNRSIRLYPHDASTFKPEEFSKKPADVLLLKNTYNFGTMPDLQAPKNLAYLLSSINPQGTIISYAWAEQMKGCKEVYSAPLERYNSSLKVFKRTPSRITKAMTNLRTHFSRTK